MLLFGLYLKAKNNCVISIRLVNLTLFTIISFTYLKELPTEGEKG